MLVSVIVPIYKGEQYIDGLLDMVRANCAVLAEEVQVELILVNDHPATPLPPVQEQIFPVRIIENPENLGIHGARVSGLAQAVGEFILFLDQDDRISEDCVASHLKVIGDSDVSVGNGYKMQGQQQKLIYRNDRKHRLATGSKYFLYAACQIVSPGHCLIRKRSIPEAWKTYIVTQNGGDDLFLWLLMFGDGAKFTVNHDIVYTHVDTGKNVSADQMTMLRSARNVIELMEQCGQVPARYIRVYSRRIRMQETLATGSKTKKALTCIRNLDICLCKLYAYYR